MVRKCASLALGLALIVALWFAMAHLPHRKITDRSNGFSAPCERTPTVAATVYEAIAVSTIDVKCPLGITEAPANFAQRLCVDPVSRTVPAPAPRAFPPLLHRPPPENS